MEKTLEDLATASAVHKMTAPEVEKRERANNYGATMVKSAKDATFEESDAIMVRPPHKKY